MKYLFSHYLIPWASVPSLVKYLWSIHSVLGSVIGNMNLQRRWTQPLASICQSCRRGAPVDRKLYHSVRCTVIEESTEASEPRGSPAVPRTCFISPLYTPGSFPPRGLRTSSSTCLEHAFPTVHMIGSY